MLKVPLEEKLHDRRKMSLPHTMFLHDTQELDNDLGAGSNEDLALPGLFGVVDGIERIIEDTGLDHFEILSSMVGVEVSRVRTSDPSQLSGVLSVKSALERSKGSSAHVANFALPRKLVMDMAKALLELLGAQESCLEPVRLVITYLVEVNGVMSARFGCKNFSMSRFLECAKLASTLAKGR